MIAGFAADLVISVSRKSGQDLAAVGRIPPEKIKVIGLGVKPAPVIDKARAKAVRRSLLGDTGKFLAVTIARLTHQKGIDILVETAARVVAQRPDIHFAVVGDGHQEADAKAWAEAAGVARNLHFVGRSEEPHLYLAASDLFLLTSRWEARPFTMAGSTPSATWPPSPRRCSTSRPTRRSARPWAARPSPAPAKTDSSRITSTVRSRPPIAT
jgi:glycosyltransferase involved in cell wall biosynthesis